MARSRKYGWNGELPAKELSGQAKIVFDGIKNAEPDTMKTGKDWTEMIGPGLKTRQDPYRVVLYYILILKALGVIKTEEFDINAVTKNAENATHAVTVKSTAIVQTGAPVLNVENNDSGDDDGEDDGDNDNDNDNDDQGDTEGTPEEVAELLERS